MSAYICVYFEYAWVVECLAPSMSSAPGHSVPVCVIVREPSGPVFCVSCATGKGSGLEGEGWGEKGGGRYLQFQVTKTCTQGNCHGFCPFDVSGKKLELQIFEMISLCALN